jgi:hypothetical protein
MKMSDFIGKMFQARDVAHSAHLNSHSYSEHMALCEFYNARKNQHLKAYLSGSMI